VILFYFAAHWCPPCRSFTPLLADIYAELTTEEEPLEVVFVSGDASPEELLAHTRDGGHGHWLCVQHGALLAAELKKRYSVRGLPTVIVTDRQGHLISKSGRSELTERGRDIFREWLTAVKQC